MDDNIIKIEYLELSTDSTRQSLEKFIKKEDQFIYIVNSEFCNLLTDMSEHEIKWGKNPVLELDSGYREKIENFDTYIIQDNTLNEPEEFDTLNYKTFTFTLFNSQSEKSGKRETVTSTKTYDRNNDIYLHDTVKEYRTSFRIGYKPIERTVIIPYVNIKKIYTSVKDQLTFEEFSAKLKTQLKQTEIFKDNNYMKYHLQSYRGKDFDKYKDKKKYYIKYEQFQKDLQEHLPLINDNVDENDKFYAHVLIFSLQMIIDFFGNDKQLYTEKDKSVYHLINKTILYHDYTMTDSDFDYECTNKEYKKIYVLSDLHADYRKFVDMLQKNYIVNPVINVNGDDIYDIQNICKFDFQQENTLLVIVGDLVDGKRPVIKHSVRDEHGNFEIFLLALVVQLKFMAKKKFSDVIFTWGNHDITRMNPKRNINEIYTYENHKNLEHYAIYFYQICPFIMYKVKEVVFVHGSMHSNKYLYELNKDNASAIAKYFKNIKQLDYTNEYTKKDIQNITKDYFLDDNEEYVNVKNGPIIFTRKYSYDNDVYDTNRYQFRSKTYKMFENDDPNHLLTIVGHCINSELHKNKKDHFDFHDEQCEKRDYDDNSEKATVEGSVGCIYPRFFEKFEGAFFPRVIMVDTALSEAFQFHAKNTNKSIIEKNTDRTNEILLLEHEPAKKAKSTRHYTDFKFVRNGKAENLLDYYRTKISSDWRNNVFGGKRKTQKKSQRKRSYRRRRHTSKRCRKTRKH